MEIRGPAMNDNHDMPIKIRRIKIQDYKGIDELEMNFPGPRMPDEPDIIVMGSENGLGKTSLIECCALLLLAISLGKERFMLGDRYSTINVPDLLIKAGAPSAKISGDMVLGDKSITVQMRLDRHGGVKISGELSAIEELGLERRDPESAIDAFIRAICGFTPNPVIANEFLLFHSYRKVQEGNPELGMMVDRGRSPRRPPFLRYEFPMSAFKLRLLRSMMGKANLFESVEDHEPDDTIKKLNELMLEYAGGEIHKLRPAADNTVDFRVLRLGEKNSFTFDGLSSGQKEIISTLFLIWYHTLHNPSVVFIDEPELHLNGQWHRSFVQKLLSLAPQNQYIIATHSEDVMASVNDDRRVLLYNENEEING